MQEGVGTTLILFSNCSFGCQRKAIIIKSIFSPDKSGGNCHIAAHCLQLGPVSSSSCFHAGGLLPGSLSSSFKKKIPINVLQEHTGTRPPNLYAFFFFSFSHHLFASAFHLLLGFTCSVKVWSLGHKGLCKKKQTFKTRLGRHFYAQETRH